MESRKDDLVADLRAQAQQYENLSETVSTTTNSKQRVDNDGVVYEFDEEKRAWFPKIDDDFIAAYQYHYGTNTNQQEPTTGVITAANMAPPTAEAAKPIVNASNAIPKQKQKGEESKDRKSQPEGWFDVDETKNTNVYVSGLPMDTTEEEFVELMSKCGIIMQDDDTKEFKVKLYRDTDGQLKGDGRCCYLKVESVDLALQILDGSLFKDSTINVERAMFTLKGRYDPSLRKKKKNTKKRKRKTQEKLLSWNESKSEKRSKLDKVLIVKNIFHPDEFEKDPTYITELKSSVKEECEAKFGPIKKIIIFDRHPEGVISITFANPEDRDKCLEVMHGRYFAKRKLHAEKWDGFTNYQIEETDMEREERIKKWEAYIEEDNA
ncbi:HIV Tat-specific factor 1-like protein [Trichoplax sp. H2]|uniref:17S U2 SnRNP complex component HTATSF1 n=1 Tax=Trichoplax adhaerens TaxID=10228 RepID=B3RY41_TRIAD|nr:hypothetical protein TRIADDRAFT_63946 [Trichoplax adhaerens]EDV24533.1 hypothetical protein TRIADDRAFT_63946 [Trichoplax adhaerens]RDD46795.1 HIV Tat-specific factor 1-like protein [Trichoplax sp. H2]|eukprot:XP_002112423.1 hypothetical protein TRIADDRAFT_63946 [Trichoplax adhaerens]